MTQFTEPTEDVIATFLPQILDNEAKGILSDLAAQPNLALEFMDFTQNDTQRAIKHVVGIFEECFHAGHLKVIVSHINGTLYGYALVFILPTKVMAAYCHKIFVYEPYRGRGIGRQILSAVLEGFPEVCLICSPELCSFYTKAGLKYKGDFSVPQSQPVFTLSSGLYEGLAIMSTVDTTGREPMFLLNDEDVGALLAIRYQSTGE
ncbi:GNAT family N-acetyltransferase [Pseudomonas sp. DG56-2]|uniref:GNAT family N-acetyltransferase n=1 Tax=Pseudomonas sp. DG56-2 TaxID=2320270 RepID=UPI0010A69D6F|nr:GNAT family N-acetyltransferase [Pseudomonas sp. DG56-2]